MESSTITIAQPGSVEAIDHILVPALTQLVIRSAPFITGFAPFPYAEKVIGLPAKPEEGIINSSRQLSPLLNKIKSPGKNVLLFILDIVLQGVVVEVPLFASFPLDET